MGKFKFVGKLLALFSALSVGGAFVATTARADTSWWWNNYDYNDYGPSYDYYNDWRPRSGLSISIGTVPNYSCRVWDGWSWRYGYFDYSYGRCRYYEPRTRTSTLGTVFGILSSLVSPRWYGSNYYNNYWGWGSSWRPWSGIPVPFHVNPGAEATTLASDDSVKNVCRASVNSEKLPGMVINGNCEVPIGRGVSVVSGDWEFPVFESR